jgi:hypothetical protein
MVSITIGLISSCVRNQEIVLYQYRNLTEWSKITPELKNLIKQYIQYDNKISRWEYARLQSSYDSLKIERAKQKALNGEFNE